MPATSSKTAPSTKHQSLATSQPTVYVIGAGFSAGLGYPLVHDLLIRLWSLLPSAQQEQLTEVIRFHHPSFDPNWRTSFPTVEHLLSEMMTHEQLFDASSSVPGKFSLEKLTAIRRDLLLSIAEWFHAIHAKTFKNLPGWLESFRDQVLIDGDTIISFNWDLVLDQLIFGDEVDAKSYGLRRGLQVAITLFKPHGSLNWYDGDQGARIKQQLRFPLHTDAGGQKIYAFRHFRSPKSKNKYMPMIIPPVYNKDFSRHVFRDIWRGCVARLSAASKVVFLGYSLPEPDLHARFILRCGFKNQLEAVRSHVVIVNPDQGAASRIERCVGHDVRCDWQPMPVAEWIDQQTV